MLAAELSDVREVMLRMSVERLISRPGRKALCAACGEEIMNEREHVAAAGINPRVGVIC